MNNNIQALRALAALAVLLFHVQPYYKDLAGTPIPFERLLLHGYAGVDVFFVISGYVIALTTAAQLPGLAGAATFLERRAFRIYLGYWPILALASLYYLRFDPSRLARVEVFASVFLSSTEIADLVIGQAWTLSYELFFYVLFAMLLGIAPARRVSLLVAGFCLVALFNALAGEAAEKGWMPFRPFVLEFIAGALFYHLCDRLRGHLALLLAAAMVLFLFALGVELDARQGLVRVACFGGAGVGLLAIAVNLRNSGRNTRGLLATMGGASYTLYLCHYTLIEAFVTWLRAAFPNGREPIPVAFAFFALIVTIVLFSQAYYVRVERPLYLWACAQRRWRPSFWLARRVPVDRPNSKANN